MNFQDLFELAMDRPVPDLEHYCPDFPIPFTSLNLGAGEKVIPGTAALDYPSWDADKDPIPWPNNSVDVIHAYHFLEHCSDPVAMLVECQRVLKPGGYMNICVPYYTSQMMAHDLDHKHPFCEDTWKILFKNPYYNKNKIDWKFRIGFNLICGIVERNLCLLTQLIKE